MPDLDRIILDPAILAGKPVVRGTRLSVELLVGLLAHGWSQAEVLANYPGLTREDLLACRAFLLPTTSRSLRVRRTQSLRRHRDR